MSRQECRTQISIKVNPLRLYRLFKDSKDFSRIERLFEKQMQLACSDGSIHRIIIILEVMEQLNDALGTKLQPKT